MGFEEEGDFDLLAVWGFQYEGEDPLHFFGGAKGEHGVALPVLGLGFLQGDSVVSHVHVVSADVNL